MGGICDDVELGGQQGDKVSMAEVGSRCQKKILTLSLKKVTAAKVTEKWLGQMEKIFLFCFFGDNLALFSGVKL